MISALASNKAMTKQTNKQTNKCAISVFLFSGYGTNGECVFKAKVIVVFAVEPPALGSALARTNAPRPVREIRPRACDFNECVSVCACISLSLSLSLCVCVLCLHVFVSYSLFRSAPMFVHHNSQHGSARLLDTTRRRARAPMCFTTLTTIESGFKRRRHL